MNSLLKYKDYFGTIYYSEEDNLLIGKVIGIRDSITYHGDDVEKIKKSFTEAIDFYLESCEEEGLKPDQTNLAIVQAMEISFALHDKIINYSFSNNKPPCKTLEEAEKLLELIS